MADPHNMPDLLSATAEPGALSAPASQRVEVPHRRSSTAAGFSVLFPPSLGPGPRTTHGQSSQACTFPPNHAAPGPLPSAGRGCGAFGPDNSGDALPPTESVTDPRLDSRPVRIDAPRLWKVVHSIAQGGTTAGGNGRNTPLRRGTFGPRPYVESTYIEVLLARTKPRHPALLPKV